MQAAEHAMASLQQGCVSTTLYLCMQAGQLTMCEGLSQQLLDIQADSSHLQAQLQSAQQKHAEEVDHLQVQL